MSKMICITGMHRSGTSLVASWLEGCGLTLFDKAGPHIGNPLGHYEDERILKVHMAAIRRIRNQSKGWIVGRKSKLSFTDHEKSQLVHIVNERFKLAEVWGWKEPRASLFLNEWKKMVPEMKTILLWRSCDLVVDSLIRRSKESSGEPVFQINYNQAITNWKVYNESIYNYYLNNSDSAVLVNIDFVLKKSIDVIRKINEKFNIELEEKNIEANYHKEMINLNIDNVPTVTKFYKNIYNIKALEHKLTEASLAE